MLDGTYRVTALRHPTFANGPRQSEMLVFKDGFIVEIITLSNRDTSSLITYSAGPDFERFSFSHWVFENSKRNYAFHVKHIGDGNFEKEVQYLTK